MLCVTGPHLEAFNWTKGSTGRGGDRWWWVAVDATEQHRAGDLELRMGLGAKVRGSESRGSGRR